MAIISTNNLLHLLLLISAFILRPANAGVEDFLWLSNQGTKCSGSIAECMIGEEFEMESESNRRILATTNYISYGALKGNNVPCSQRGASYYNCRSGGQVNPYQRGCSAITRCRR